MTKQYKVGIYCRLSVDDASNSAKAKHYIPSEESVSIENQYEILSKFAMLNGWIEVKTYRDDGYSGGNFQRPGFLEMLEDARHGLINLILVKDLSRLGRDFVEVGRYTTPARFVHRKAGLRGLRTPDGCQPPIPAPKERHGQTLCLLLLLPVCYHRTQHLFLAPGFRDHTEKHCVE